MQQKQQGREQIYSYDSCTLDIEGQALLWRTQHTSFILARVVGFSLKLYADYLR
jgi:hypothetical protein